MGPNPLLARMATKKAKPDGVYRLRLSEAEQYLSSVGVSALPGVGRKMTKKLEEKFGVQVCGDLQKVSLENLVSEFGAKTGKQLHSSCRGLVTGEDDELVFDQERKSVSSEVNYGIRFTNLDECHKFVVQLSEEVCRRLNEISDGLRAKTVTLKLMVRAECEKGKETVKFMGHGICDSHSKSSNFPGGPTNDSRVITREVLSVLDTLMKSHNVQPDDLRGIGVQLSKFQPSDPRQAGSILNFVKKGSTTSDFNEPSTSRAVSAIGEKSATKSREENAGCWKSENLANMDPTVLSHLPPEIRKEIEDQINTMAKNAATKDKKSVGSYLESDPYQDLSFSQLDPEFMSALPQSMVDELKAELQSRQATSSSSKTVFEKMMSASKLRPSPAKMASSASNSPSFKKAKSPKNSPRFIKKSNTATVVSVGSVTKRLPLDDVNETKAKSETGPYLEPAKATLQGFRELKDLKPLYQAWIGGTDSPTDDDMKTCQSFLCDVVKENDLELVYISLKNIRRLCLEANSVNWNNFYNDLVNQLQEVMLQTYGKKLFVRF